MSLLRRATPDEQFEEVTRGTVDLQVAEELKSKLQPLLRARASR